MARRTAAGQGFPVTKSVFYAIMISLAGLRRRSAALDRWISLCVIGIILPSTGQAGVFALGAGAFVVAALAVLIVGEETRGRTLEA